MSSSFTLNFSLACFSCLSCLSRSKIVSSPRYLLATMIILNARTRIL